MQMNSQTVAAYTRSVQAQSDWDTPLMKKTGTTDTSSERRISFLQYKVSGVSLTLWSRPRLRSDLPT